MRALLDVNVVIALLDGGHAHHQRAHAWWSAHAAAGWASCPLVENGVVRIMSHPAYSSGRRFTVAELIGALSLFASSTNHEFWPDEVTLREGGLFAADRIHGGRQLTDLYLLALAVRHGGKLVTFDQTIPLSAVKTAGAVNLTVV